MEQHGVGPTGPNAAPSETGYSLSTTSASVSVVWDVSSESALLVDVSVRRLSHERRPSGRLWFPLELPVTAVARVTLVPRKGDRRFVPTNRLSARLSLRTFWMEERGDGVDQNVCDHDGRSVGAQFSRQCSTSSGKSRHRSRSDPRSYSTSWTSWRRGRWA
jgi:hypothetical protein